MRWELDIPQHKGENPGGRLLRESMSLSHAQRTPLILEKRLWLEGGTFRETFNGRHLSGCDVMCSGFSECLNLVPWALK